MQIPGLVLALAIEVYFLLLVATLVLVWYARKQKKLVSLQQDKLLELIDELKAAPSAPSPKSAGKSYKQFINEQLDTTQAHFNNIAPGVDISGSQPSDVSLDQRIVALRYAFLRAEELGTTEPIGTSGYWDIFMQTLEPLLPQAEQALPDNQEELETYKKRIANLEKFKKLYFDLEAKWQEAQEQADGYYAQLNALLGEDQANQEITNLLNDYHHSYFALGEHFRQNQFGADGEPKIINIVRQDPRAADEIMKLRNVAADQYRLINNLQRKLEEAQSDQQKAMIVQELEQQLHRQIRFVQESETCIQLLEDELAQANDKIARQEQQLETDQEITIENQRMKETLQSFSQESKTLVSSINELEQENSKLRSISPAESTDILIQTETSGGTEASQAELLKLQKQYADLEEKYLALKLK